MKSLPKSLRAFTLIELLVVIGVLTVLLAIVLIAINPARQFAQANNTQRRSDVNAVLNAVHQYGADNKGDLSALGIDATERLICGPLSGVAAPCPDASSVDFCALVAPTYIANLPIDPLTGSNPAAGDELCTDASGGDEYVTGYTIRTVAGASGRIRVAATAEAVGGSTPTIEVTR